MGMQQMLLGMGAGEDPVYLDRIHETRIWTGSGSQKTVTNDVDLSNEGGLVWIAQRTEDGDDAVMIDTERGATKVIRSNTNTSETTDSSILDQFNADGYRIGSSRNVNGTANTRRYSGWTFRKAPHFFDVVKYDGDGTSDRQIAHNLGSAPGFMLVKSYNATVSWGGYHRDAGNNKSFSINSPGDFGTDNNIWSATDPTATHFTVGNSGYSNQSGRSYVCYLWGHGQAKFGETGDQKVIHCGSFTASTSWQDIDLDFECGFLYLKRDAYNPTSNPRSAACIFDRGFRFHPRFDNHDGNLENARCYGTVVGGGDGARNHINNGRSLEEYEDCIEFTTEGFRTKWEGNYANTDTWHYVAIREQGHGATAFPVTDGTKVFSFDAGNNNSTKPTFNSTHFVDWAMSKHTDNNNDGFCVTTRISGSGYNSTGLAMHKAGHEGHGSEILFTNGNAHYYDNGWGDHTSVHSDVKSWMFKNHQGLTVTHYLGNGSNRMIRHGLAQKPKMVWVKSLSRNTNWTVYLEALGNTKWTKLDDVTSYGSASSAWNNTDPTATHMSIGTWDAVNYSNDYYYMWSFGNTDVSHVGTYTGNGSSSGPTISDPGFTPRLLVIKKLEANSNWCFFSNVFGNFDSSGSDSILYLNEKDAVAGVSYVNTTGTGFAIESNNSEVNSNGSTYVYWAQK